MSFFKGMAGLLGIIILWIAVSIYGALNGWWLSPIAPPKETQAFISAVKEKIHSEKLGNVALTVIENGEVIAEDFSGAVDVIDRDTLFPLASMSKLFTAYGVMQFVEAGKIELDAPVADYLKRWRLPESDFDNGKVTIRQLLSHTSGLTDGLGFGDYEPDEEIPSLEASLSNPRASNGPRAIQVGREPGTAWEYSGGGYLLTQLLVEETSGMDFDGWMQQAVFTPLGMNRSTYEYLGGLDNISPSYDTDGAPSTIFRYASAAATGLSSTPADLTRFVKALLRSDSDYPGGLSQESVRTMRRPHGYKMGAAIWGLGVMLYAPVPGGDYVFGHDGANDPAINTALRINPDSGDAIIVLANGRKSLASSVAYEWTLWQTGYPDFLSLDRAVKSALVPCAVGILVIVAGFTAILMRKRKAKTKI